MFNVRRDFPSEEVVLKLFMTLFLGIPLEYNLFSLLCG